MSLDNLADSSSNIMEKAQTVTSDNNALFFRDSQNIQRSAEINIYQATSFFRHINYSID